jgi:rRNA maturation RNase YbeY
MESLINFYSKTDFSLGDQTSYETWLKKVIESEAKTLGHLSYIFCSDEDLLKINQEYLDHDTFTDIITFDYTEGNTISAEIYISIDRVKENAEAFEVEFKNEFKRVLVHGVLHCCGYSDATDELKSKMRELENKKIELFHVEQK